MTKLSRLVAPALFASLALGAAMPAQAYHAPRGDHAVARQIDQLQFAVQRADGRDRVSEREAAGLRHAVFELKRQYRQLSRDGLSRGEQRFLERRIDSIRSRLHHERRDRDGHRW